MTTLLLVFLGMVLLSPFLTCAPPGSRKKAQRIKCIHNLRILDQAKDEWAYETDSIPGDPVVDAEILELAQLREFKCPAGGNYVIGPVDATPTCSTPGHALAP